MEEKALSLLQAVGLPTMFCMWLMFRVEKRLDEQTDHMKKAAELMGGILEHVRQERD